MSRLQTERGRLRNVEALVERLSYASDSSCPPTIPLPEESSNGYMKSLLEVEGEDTFESTEDPKLDLLNIPISTLDFRRSSDLQPGSDRVEKPIRVRKHTRQRRRH
jgi:hypothetical protein